MYEVFNKETWVVSPVVSMTIGDTFVEATIETGEVITFANPEASGQLSNDQYLIRQIEGHLEADGEGTVEFPTDSAEAEVTE
jgi:hypothetical protein